MADQLGVEQHYLDAEGRDRLVPRDTVQHLHAAIGIEPQDHPSVIVARPELRVVTGPGHVVLEDGSEMSVADALPRDLPFGYHHFVGPDERRVAVIATPGRCSLPARRAWGWAAQLYATRSAASWGMGDLGDLNTLNSWSADTGAGFVLVNPLGAVAPAAPQEPSPYFPTSRRYRNPLYLRIEDVPGAASPVCAEAVREAARAGRELNSRRLIDRDTVWRHKRRALEAIFAHTRGGQVFSTWRTRQPDSLEQFALWSVVAEDHGGSWRTWPAPYRHPGRSELTHLASARAERVTFYAWLQWLMEQQLSGAAKALPLLQDLPIGFDPGGFDAWAWQDLLAEGVSIGAPADEFNRHGQDWGLPPFIPWKLTGAGYQPFIDTIRANLQTGGGLRIDHVMGLFRLWWLPEGTPPADGAYVRYPSDALLAIVALESHRAQAVVVGEDLGTVEESARRTLADHDVLSYRLLWFEADDPRTWPQKAMAAVTTHDLPTVAGLWDGSDLLAQRRAGLHPNEKGTRTIRKRLERTAGLRGDESSETAVLGAYRVVAHSPCSLLAATLDDVVTETERPNIPGADEQRPNWSLALPMTLEDLRRHQLTARVASILAGATDAGHRSDPTPPTLANDPEVADEDTPRRRGQP